MWANFREVKRSRKLIFLVLLALACLFLHLYSRNPFRAEFGYFPNIFVPFSHFLRLFVGSWPISLGDLLYGFLVLWFLYLLAIFIVQLVSKKGVFVKKVIADKILSILISVMIVYLIFNLCWGINYNRKGISWQLGLRLEKQNKADLEAINIVLLEKVNASKEKLKLYQAPRLTENEIFLLTDSAYKNVAVKYSFLQYNPSSIKSSMWSSVLNYTGFTGYYNPFTGEAQVNTSIPVFLQPFIACHEVAHQLGYAKEMEANFVGFLAGRASKNPRFLYSVYLDIFLYANRDLWLLDSTAAKHYRNQLSEPIKSDLKEWQQFNKQHESFLQPALGWMYDSFLKQNNQPEGLLSYDRVTAFVSAYYKKYGEL